MWQEITARVCVFAWLGHTNVIIQFYCEDLSLEVRYESRLGLEGVWVWLYKKMENEWKSMESPHKDSNTDMGERKSFVVICC